MSYQIRSDLWRPVFGALLLGIAVACASEAPEPTGPAPAGPPDPASYDGAVVWATQCAACHGDRGEGGVAAALSGWAGGRDALVATIDSTMPLGSPQACVGACATAVADYVLAELQAGPARCDEPSSPPRQVRLLTRREYANTVRAIFGRASAEGPACDGPTDCDLPAESCVEGRCAARPCGRYAFYFDAGAARPSSVVVAGSFNGWAARVEDGAWPLAPVPGTSRWLLERDLPDGRHSYKLVLDGDDWRTDPSSPATEPDGYGGQNSVVEITCEGAGGPAAPADLASITDGFPVESRPSGYFFDNGAEAGRVSAVHLAEYMAAAARLADVTLADPERHLGCAPRQPGCIAQGLARLGRRAFRRPLTDAELARYQGLVGAEADAQDGLRVALRVMFSSPDFLYRTELGQAEGGAFVLGPYETASALSYLFWAAPPDDTLLEAAAAGRLDTPEGRAEQAARLLEDPRARAQVSRLVVQWLGADKVLGKVKHPGQHPGFDEATRAALLEETRRFVEHVVFDGSGDLADLFVADFTFVNDRLAAFYGLGAGGAEFTKVSYPNGRRAGVLGHGSVLATYAHSDQSSPILRGVFVRERLLCQAFGAPPANAGGVPDVDPNATTRERFRQHSDDPTCRSCHRYIDGVGFGFERFDAVGAYRETENGLPVDAAGEVEDLEGFGVGTRQTFSSLPELGRLVADSAASKACFVTQYWRFAHGRLERPEDACTIDRLTAAFAEAGFDVKALMIATAKDPAFVTRQ